MSRWLLLAVLLVAAVPAVADDGARYQYLTVDGIEGMLDLNPDLSHCGFDYSLLPNGTVTVAVVSTLPDEATLLLSRNGAAPQPLAARRFTESLREGTLTLALLSRHPLAGDSAVLTITRHGDAFAVLPPAPETLPRRSTINWRWDDAALLAALPLPVVARDTGGSGAFAARLVQAVNQRLDSCTVRDAAVPLPALLLAAGDRQPGERQRVLALVAAAWRNQLPARLVLVRNAQGVERHLVEFYMPELAPGKWVLHDPVSGTPFFGQNGPLSATELMQMVATAGSGELAIRCANQPVAAAEYAYLGLALDNDFATNPRWRQADARITYATLRVATDEYAGIKRWSQRLGIGLFIVALLGIIGIKLFGPEEPEDNGDSTPPSAS
ncbi:MAG TPA: hypothetical protein PKM88_04655 [bacterium]|nr:hypothetical protein [bacterium]